MGRSRVEPSEEFRDGLATLGIIGRGEFRDVLGKSGEGLAAKGLGAPEERDRRGDVPGPVEHGCAISTSFRVLSSAVNALWIATHAHARPRTSARSIGSSTSQPSHAYPLAAVRAATGPLSPSTPSLAAASAVRIGVGSALATASCTATSCVSSCGPRASSPERSTKETSSWVDSSKPGIAESSPTSSRPTEIRDFPSSNRDSAVRAVALRPSWSVTWSASSNRRSGPRRYRLSTNDGSSAGGTSSNGRDPARGRAFGVPDPGPVQLVRSPRRAPEKRRPATQGRIMQASVLRPGDIRLKANKFVDRHLGPSSTTTDHAPVPPDSKPSAKITPRS